jgi:MscS family membrane protein
MSFPAWHILDQQILGNTVENYIWFAGILFVGLVFRHLISKFFSFLLFRLIKRFSGNATPREFYDLLKGPFSWFLLLIVGYIAFNTLDYPEKWQHVAGKRFSVEHTVQGIYKLVVIISVTWIFLRLVDFFALILSHRAAKTESRLDDQLVPFFRDGLKIIVVIFSLFFTLGVVFHVNVVTLIGGLGIGGLAVALAAKETLENLLGSFTLFLDKPFIVGDNIKVGPVSGTVESIGLRSTRIRTLEKTQVTVPNKKMVDAELENTTERSLWRVRFSIGLIYATQANDIQNIIAQIKKTLDNHDQISSDTLVFLNEFNSSSLDVLINYLVISNDYATVMKIKEEINFKIIKIVRANNSDFAFPSTRLYVESQRPESDTDKVN